MRHSSKSKYAHRARLRFCKNTRYSAPIDLILTGKRSLEDWVAVLSEERELEQSAFQQSATQRRSSNQNEHIVQNAIEALA